MISRNELLNQGNEWLLQANFFNYLTREEQDKMLEAMVHKDYATGDYIIKRGSQARGIDIIISGQVTVVVPGDEPDRKQNKDHYMVRIGPGQLIGERSVYLKDETKADIRALSPVHTLHLSAENFNTFLEKLDNLRSYIEGLIMVRDRNRELSELISGIQIMRNLSLDDIDYLLQASRLQECQRHTRLIKAVDPDIETIDDNDINVYLVTKGSVAYYPPGAAGEGMPIAVEKTGYLCGEAQVLYGSPPSADVYMHEDGEVLVIPGPAFAAIIQQHPNMHRLLKEQMPSHRLLRKTGALVISFTGTANNLGTSTLAYGTAAALQKEGGQTILIDLNRDKNGPRLGLGVEDKEIGGILVKETDTPPSWQIRLLDLPDKSQIIPLVKELKEKSAYIVILSPANKMSDEVMRIADTMVTVYSDPELSDSIPVRWGQMHIKAFRPGKCKNVEKTSGLVPRQVRIPEDAETSDYLWKDKSLDYILESGRLLGEACFRTARVIRGCSVGLALGGGAAWGYAHIALIRAMHANGIPIDYITGSSAGSMIGGVYAAGGIEAVETFYRKMSKLKWLLPPVASLCLVSSKPISWMNTMIIGDMPIQATNIPFFPMVTDINSGSEIVLTGGKCADAIRVSCGLPGLFPSVKDGNSRYIDGGIANNVPASAVRKGGADFVIASNVIPSKPSRRISKGKGLVTDLLVNQTIGRVTDLMNSLFLLFWHASFDKTQQADYMIDLASPDYHSTDFHKVEPMVAYSAKLVDANMPFILKAYQEACSGAPVAESKQ